jgi:hypothetical protein
MLEAPAERAAEATSTQQHIGAATIAITAVIAAVATVATIGADARWLAALGGAIAAQRSIPNGVPYAAAPSAGWPNVPVLAELVFHWLNAGGNRGFVLAQALAVGGALAVLRSDMRHGRAGDSSSAVVLLTVAVGASAALFVIRVQLFSVFFFPTLALLLRSEARSPSRRVWLVPALLCVWSNLHGAVLVGLAIALIYLVVERSRHEPLCAAAVAAVSVLAVCVTPALERTPAYYLGVLRNQAARRGEGLWAPLSITSGIDLVFIVAAIVLVTLALRTRPRLWELIALAALAILAVKTARSGVWLVFLAAPPAAAGLRMRWRLPRKWATGVTVGIGIVAVYGIAHRPPQPDVSASLIRQTLERADGTPILADGLDAERLALKGGRVWMSNPLDAFSRHDQRVYLDWLDGRPTGTAAFRYAPRAVLVRRGTGAETLTASSGQFRSVAFDPRAVLYVRRR